jgi:hypothetical protein
MTIQAKGYLVLIEVTAAIVLFYVVNDGLYMPLARSQPPITLSPFMAISVNLAWFGTLAFGCKSFLDLYRYGDYLLTLQKQGEQNG